ncbi:MAG: hypothetical protein WAV38_03140 [Xanthobacteraceae bacterium]|jgi:hypothetical protein
MSQQRTARKRTVGPMTKAAKTAIEAGTISTTAPTVRIGRPMKPPAEGKRASLGLKVTAEVKAHIDAAARESGRTQSQEAERLIERALQYDELLEAMRTTVTKIKDGNIEAALRAAGYRSLHSPHGKIWVPTDYPLKQVSGFIPPADEED